MTAALADPVRTCPKCQRRLALSDFNRDSTRSSGYRWDCRQCQNARDRDYIDRLRDPKVSRGRTLRLHELRKWAETELPSPGVRKSQLPSTRGDCRGGPRPCPLLSCRWNLYCDVSKQGGLKLNRPDLEPWEMPPGASCVLDAADAGGLTLEDVGELMNLSRERIRQIEAAALSKLRKGLEREGVTIEDARDDDGPSVWDATTRYGVRR